MKATAAGHAVCPMPPAVRPQTVTHLPWGAETRYGLMPTRAAVCAHYDEADRRVRRTRALNSVLVFCHEYFASPI